MMMMMMGPPMKLQDVLTPHRDWGLPWQRWPVSKHWGCAGLYNDRSTLHDWVCVCVCV